MEMRVKSRALLADRTLPDWQPYSQMARLVSSRYGPDLDIQRLFSPADESAHGMGVSSHSIAYFSDNRLPSAVRASPVPLPFAWQQVMPAVSCACGHSKWCQPHTASCSAVFD